MMYSKEEIGKELRKELDKGINRENFKHELAVCLLLLEMNILWKTERLFDLSRKGFYGRFFLGVIEQISW